MNTTKPSAGALRAAEAFMRWNGEQTVPKYMLEARDRLALIIDSESGLAELLEAAKALVSDVELAFDKRGIAKTHAWNMTRHAIAKATNPNAETVQSYPADRENALAELLTLRDRAKAFLACADPNGPWSQDEREGLAYLRQAVHAIEKGTA